MPIQLADYGTAIFALALVAWIVVAVFAPRRKDPDLVKVISDNTQALTELTVLVKQQSELTRQLVEMIAELRLEVARREAKSA